MLLLNERKCSRNEDAPTKIIKISANISSPILSDIFNLCVQKGVFPDLMKIAQIIPIHKKGDKEDCSNYRPISIKPI